MEQVVGKVFIAETSYDASSLRARLAAKGIEAVIRPHPGRSEKVAYDQELYKERYRVEVYFNRIKHFRRVATRYDKLAVTYLGFLFLASAWVWLL